ncbi:MAG: 1-acyl-sn-glycerol-3-phosphate acyltransferase [Ramlibacter sp.]|nr:1-acyl-sn-glycerol-3-phosphate acyltransferase [Ramlibacter sp.]
MKALVAGGKLVRVMLHALRGWLTIALVFPRLARDERDARVQAWAARMLSVLGVELRVVGEPPVAGPVLLVANHISWLDILVMHAARHCRFVSKSDVRHWPLIGTLATGAGTLYIERASRRDAMRVVHVMATSLQAGDILAIFPEGTTSDGVSLLPFHANLIQAAISAGAPTLPVGLKFVDGSGQASLAPCYIGDDTLVGSIWRTLTTPGIVAVVHYGRPEGAADRDRRQWAADLRARVIDLR